MQDDNSTAVLTRLDLALSQVKRVEREAGAAKRFVAQTRDSYINSLQSKETQGDSGNGNE